MWSPKLVPLIVPIHPCLSQWEGVGMVAASFRKIMEAAKTPKMKRDWEDKFLAVNTGMVPPFCKSTRRCEKAKD